MAGVGHENCSMESTLQALGAHLEVRNSVRKPGTSIISLPPLAYVATPGLCIG